MRRRKPQVYDYLEKAREDLKEKKLSSARYNLREAYSILETSFPCALARADTGLWFDVNFRQYQELRRQLDEKTKAQHKVFSDN